MRLPGGSYQEGADSSINGEDKSSAFSYAYGSGGGGGYESRSSSQGQPKKRKTTLTEQPTTTTVLEIAGASHTSLTSDPGSLTVRKKKEAKIQLCYSITSFSRCCPFKSN